MTMNCKQEQDSPRGLKRKADKLDTNCVKKNKHCRASKAKWTLEEDEVLTRSVLVNGEGNWKKIAQTLSDRSHLQCLHRWQKVLNPALVKGPWKEEEDQKLMDLVEKYGPKDWSIIASHIQGRIGKQCRERWFNHLSPEVRKTNWSLEEDRIIVDSHLRLGNKWTAISKLLNGRPANAIKNHWNSTLLKRIQDSNISIKQERYSKPIYRSPPQTRASDSATDDESSISDCSPPFNLDHSISDPQDNAFGSNDVLFAPLPWDWPASHSSPHMQQSAPSLGSMLTNNSGAPPNYANSAYAAAAFSKDYDYGGFMHDHNTEFSDFESPIAQIPDMRWDGSTVSGGDDSCGLLMENSMPAYCSLPLM